MKKPPHAYRGLGIDETEELFSNFLIDSWSYSKVSSFARNEKAFEMSYIYRNPFKSSASAVAGSAYHEALEYYFQKRKENVFVDLVQLQKIAFNYIDSVEAKDWKIQKTNPTI